MFRLTRRRLRRTIVAGTLTATACQLGVAGGVIAVDLIRKRREPPSGEFPRTEPVRLTSHEDALTVFTEGRALYAEMLEDIRGAQASIYFESYIWKSDAIGDEFKKELTAAAHRGVAVYIIYDSLANLVVPPSFKVFDPALHVLAFPLVPGRNPLSVRTYSRDHRKILVVDDAVGYVGGYNIGQLYADTWRDTHLRIEGPAVWELSDAFCDFWNMYSRRSNPELPDQGARSWNARIRAARNLPDRMLFPVRGLYLDAIDRASHSIHLTQGYFLPDIDVVRALVRAADRGVEVKILIPEVSNHVIADWASRPNYDHLLAHGVRLFLFEHAMVHAKTMTVDGRWTTIGTTNVDRLSFTGNYEVNVELHEDQLAHHMEEVFATDLTNSHELTLSEWRKRPHVERVVERVLHSLAPLL